MQGTLNVKFAECACDIARDINPYSANVENRVSS